MKSEQFPEAVVALVRQALAMIASGGPLQVLPHMALYDPRWLGYPSPQNPEEAARLLIARGRFPLPLVKELDMNMVRVFDILTYVQNKVPAGGNVPEPTTPSPRKRGRPRSQPPASGGES